MPFPQGLLLCLGLVLMTVGVILALCTGLTHQTIPLFELGLFLGLGGAGLVVTGLCVAMKNLQVAVPGHFLLHPRTGTRFSPHQALAIQSPEEERSQEHSFHHQGFFYHQTLT
ncbi:uncharacterized protein LOC139908835 isoform X2 [Centroberyx gerrardi]